MTDHQTNPGNGNGIPSPLEVRRIDGFDLPVFWVPSEVASAAGIVFRTGRGSEPAALAGINHLIRHLTTESIGLAPHGPFDPDGVDVTGFSKEGAPEELAAFLFAMSTKLSVIPLEDLESVRHELRTEAAGWRPGPKEQLFRLRHGAMGLGARSFEEFGLRKAGHIQINAWAQKYLHGSNAAVWFAGQMPDNMRLRLVRGVPAEFDPHVLDIPTPGAAYGSKGSVALSLVAERTHAIAAAADVIAVRARHELCVNRGVSTVVTVDVERLDAGRVEVVVFADAIEGRDDEVARVLLWVIDCLVSAEPSIEEINRYRDGVAWTYHDPTGAPQLALVHAVGHITRTKPAAWPEAYADLTALTGADISRSLNGAVSTMLIQASRSCSVLEERFPHVGNWSPSPVPGARVRPVKVQGETKIDRELWIGPQGVTIREGDRVASVRYSECVMMLRDDAGYRELISENGGRVVILANAWDKGALLIQSVDREITPERTLILDQDLDRRMGHVGAERRRWDR